MNWPGMIGMAANAGYVENNATKSTTGTVVFAEYAACGATKSTTGTVVFAKGAVSGATKSTIGTAVFVKNAARDAMKSTIGEIPTFVRAAMLLSRMSTFGNMHLRRLTSHVRVDLATNP